MIALALQAHKGTLNSIRAYGRTVQEQSTVDSVDNTVYSTIVPALYLRPPTPPAAKDGAS